MNLTEFVDQSSDKDMGSILEAAGPSCIRLRDRLGDRERARSVIATSFWQSFVGSGALLSLARELDISDPRPLLFGEKIVVPRPGLERFELVILVQAPLQPKWTTVQLNEEQALAGWYNWNLRAGAPLSDFNNPGLAFEALAQSQPFGLAIASAPHTELLSGVLSSSCTVTSAKSSSAGVVAKDSALNVGVTAALHAVDPKLPVTVGLNAGTVLSIDIISDSCFIQMQQQDLPAVGSRGANGRLSGILPRGNERASFDGGTSGHQKTVITGWSLELPTVQLYNQLKVYTTQDTNPGDSGAALITDSPDDRIVGFAFERSGGTAPIQYSTWIWADLVKQALKVEF